MTPSIQRPAETRLRLVLELNDAGKADAQRFRREERSESSDRLEQISADELRSLRIA